MKTLWTNRTTSAVRRRRPQGPPGLISCSGESSRLIVYRVSGPPAVSLSPSVVPPLQHICDQRSHQRGELEAVSTASGRYHETVSVRMMVDEKIAVDRVAIETHPLVC